MPETLMLGIGAVAGAVITLILVFARRLATGSRDLGTEAERATFSTLHTASRLAGALRGGNHAPELGRATKHIRALLAAEAVALVGQDGVVSLDGTTTGLEESAARIAERVRAAGTRRVFPKRAGSAHGWEAVGAPILLDGEVWGVVIAFSSPVRAPLVRAIEEVAQWCSAQLALGELDASRTALAEAELRSLRAQISPHFIYNALTAIASFITTDPARARELVLEFADFTRYSFRRRGEFTTLAEELGSVHSYLEIERARFGDRLDVRLRISPETLATVLPFLAVQPLVENAVRHGLEPGERGGRITVASVDDGTHTVITVEDDGVGMDPDRVVDLLSGPGGGIHVGLRNVDTRLRQLYGSAAGLVVETNVGAGTLVRMRVPKSQPHNEID